MSQSNLTETILKLQDELTGHICTKWAGQPVCVYESIDSTNAEITRLAVKGAAHGTVVMADNQTAGRGRRGRSWESPSGDNLYFSLLLRPEVTPDKAPMLTLVMAVAAARAVSELTGHEAGIKWPNDLVMDGRKVCGILTEMRMRTGGANHTAANQQETCLQLIDHVVIGVGINISEQVFPEELQDKATSLETICGQSVSRGKLLGAVLEAFEGLYEAFVAAGDLRPILDTYNGLLVNLDREVTVLDPQGAYSGIARGITNTGELVVELEDGLRKEVFAGEVSVRGIYGYV